MPKTSQRIVDLIPRLRRYARVLARGDVETADDLVQDCLERALGRLDYWKRGTDLRAWLFTIMHNLHVNHIRKQRPMLSTENLDESEQSLCALTKAEHSAELEELERAIDKLPDSHRQVLILVALEGLRYREAANILNIPEGTVMSRLSRARQQLRDRLHDAESNRLRRVK